MPNSDINTQYEWSRTLQSATKIPLNQSLSPLQNLTFCFNLFFFLGENFVLILIYVFDNIQMSPSGFHITWIQSHPTTHQNPFLF